MYFCILVLMGILNVSSLVIIINNVIVIFLYL